ncbi:MAG: 1-deoxy-D-xylulose-5-phosphate synthase [Rikenellaceae bacterium]|nr:1-deoxy-D-xylulose-5-phosphate synthase [Rikenellaceae bacterium]
MTHIEYKYLNSINTPADLRKLSVEELPRYCEELRQYIIEQCAINPGHLASSLGAVEIAVAIHYVYDTPNDALVWDVGHQAYAHKIITGRREAFRENRRKGGISGFPRMAESEYDAFGAGHSSVSISAALGIAEAAKFGGRERKVVAVIGDGSIAGGLAFEGLNNAGADKNNDLLVILNDNNMSIDRSQGALNGYLLRLSLSHRYNRFKQGLWSLLSHTPAVLNLCRKAGNAIKHGLLQNSNLFESLGFRYFGRVDGHNVALLVRTLRSLKNIKSPKLLHIITQKGHGYAPAEDNLPVWHAPGRFDPETGVRIKSESKGTKFQDVFGQTLLDLARTDERVVGITPAMPSGCSMTIMMEAMPERCFDVGIAEGHAVTFSAGLAAGGARPFCNIYSTFMQRAYDNIIHDVALQNLPVTLCLDRGGLVGEDGATHHGTFDLAYLGCVPNIVVATPSDEAELRNMMYTALRSNRPCAIRYPRGEGRGAEWRDRPFEEIAIGRARTVKEGDRVAVFAFGPLLTEVEKGVARYEAECGESGVGIYDMRYAKPLDEALVLEVARRVQRIITIEDGVVRGGAGEAVVKLLCDHDITTAVTTLGVGDTFVEHGTVAELRSLCGIDAEAVYDALKR